MRSAPCWTQDWRQTLRDFVWLQLRGSRNAAHTQQQIEAALESHGLPRAAALRAGLALLTALDQRTQLAHIHQPALVLSGQNDRVTSPAAGRWMAETLPNARHVEIARAGHAPLLSHVDEVAAAIGRVPACLIRLDAFRLEPREWRAPSARPAAATTRRPCCNGTCATSCCRAPAPCDCRRARCSTWARARATRPRTEARFRRAEVIAADISPQMLEQCRRRSHWWRPIRCVEADARALPFESASVDLVFTNLMLQWVDPPDDALAEMRRVLRPGGLLLASSFGPETLQELRAAWAAVDDGVHVNGFVDVHDLGSALQRAGFIEPVLDVDRHVHHYADVRGADARAQGHRRAQCELRAQSRTDRQVAVRADAVRL